MGSASVRPKSQAMDAPKKRPHINHSMATKLEVVRLGERGQPNKAIASALGLADSTVYTMLKNAALIKANARKAGLLGRACPASAKLKGVSGGTKGKVKKNVVFHSLATKMEVLRRKKKGETRSSIARAMNLAPSSVFEILKRSSRVRAAAQREAAQKAAAAKKAAAEAAALKAAAGKAVASKNTKATANTSDKSVVNGEPKRSRFRPHSAATRLEIVRRSESGQPVSQISKAMNVAMSTVHYILKRARETNARPEAGAETKEAVPKIVPASRVKEAIGGPVALVLENMERLLTIWLEEQLSQAGPVPDEAVQAKAVSLWRFVWHSLSSKETHGLGNNFTASPAWLEGFKKRSGRWPSPLAWSEPGPTTPRGVTKAPSRTPRRTGAPQGFSSLLRARIEVGGYTPQQVISLDEVLLPWRRLPANTVAGTDQQPRQESRDWMSLTLGANAAGDLKLKPLLVYHEASPPALQGYSREHLPVVWQPHPRGRLVEELSQGYVAGQVSQQCAAYAAEHGLPDKFLLLVDSDPAHPPSLGDGADNIRVMFVPTMSRTVVQPMDSGITAAFRQGYLAHLLRQLARQTAAEDRESLDRFWQQYGVRQAVNTIKMAWDDVPAATLNAAWHSIWPECVQGPAGPAQDDAGLEEVVGLAHCAGYLQLTVQDIREASQDPGEEASTESLPKAEEGRASEGAGEEPEGDAVKTLEPVVLGRVLALFDQAMSALEHSDPNLSRSCEVSRTVQQAIAGYRLLHTTQRRTQHTSPTTTNNLD